MSTVSGYNQSLPSLQEIDNRQFLVKNMSTVSGYNQSLPSLQEIDNQQFLVKNMSIVSGYNRSLLSLQEIDYQRFLEKDTPAVVFLVILSIVGSVGNVHTLLVYTKSPEMAKVAVRTFIIWLSATDLIACVVCMPFAIFDNRFSYTFSSVVACKFFRFLNHAVSFSSGGFLAAIAIERFKISARGYVQRNSTRRLSLSSASINIVLLSVLISSPAFMFYGPDIIETHIADLNGTQCTVLAEYKSLSTAGVYTGIVVFLSTALCVVCIVLYSKIWYVIRIQSVSNSKINNKPQSQVNSSDSKNKKMIEKGSKYEKSKRLTISLIVATAVSYAGYLLFVTAILFEIASPDLYKSIHSATGILLRAYFINNATNPIVFCFLHSEFRKECLKLYKKPFCRNK